MTAEELISRQDLLPYFDGARRSGEWVFRYCPCHADGSKHRGRGGESLGLSDQGVLRCFAGCSFKDILEALRGPHATRAPDDQFPPEDWEAEGFEVLTQLGAKLGGLTPRELWDRWCEGRDTGAVGGEWVVRFKLVSLTAHGEALKAATEAKLAILATEALSQPRLMP